MRSLRPGVVAAIREARAADVAALARLETEADALHARIAPGFFRAPSGEGASRLAAALAAPDETVRVAEVGGEIVGAVHAAVLDTPPDPALAEVRRLHVDTLIVAGEHRRRGVARRLLAEVERWGRARGAAQCVLTLWEGNDAAARFYQAAGYGTLHRVLFRNL